ncbi:hypothetical protein [Streptomyces sp. NBC_01353]|uniref:hypothetical protein n=1 Tax=Streptomyces sp. NBC_01353 TaxID=2903835 RepID=UPI002E2FA774|nr:hypothetical protein [Streptomyces sp. NBC_01353]
MSITSPIPVLQGSRGTELRSEGEELVLSRSDEVLRIPFAAIARVRAEGRDVALELTAPALAEPTVYRIEDVSRAAATVFADVVNGVLPERPAGEAAVDGATLVTTRSLRAPAEEEDEEADPTGTRIKWAGIGLGIALVAFSVVVGIAGKHVGRGIAVLLLGALGAAATIVVGGMILSAWERWYLPRYGITVEASQVFLDGRTTYAYADAEGKLHPISSSPKGETIRVAYSPRKGKGAVVCQGWGPVAQDLFAGAFVAVFAVPIDYGVVVLALPAFGG